mgnify:FL=1
MIAALLLAAWGSTSCPVPFCAVAHPRAPDVVLVLGHSLANGNGDDANFGDWPLPAGVSLVHGGSTRTTWPSAPSVVPYLAARMARPCTFVVRAAGGATISQIGGTHWSGAQADLATLGLTPDRVVVWSGENDTGTTIARDAYAATLETLLDSIEDTYPSAEIDIIQIAGDSGTMVYATEVRAHQAAAVALEPARRHLVDPRPSNPLLQTDRVHLVGGVGGGSEVVARLLVGAW